MAPTEDEAIELLRETYDRNGYVRRPDMDRRAEEGAQAYKKGWEVRLMAGSKAELEEVQRALKAVGLEPGAPFDKHAQTCQPVYGRDAVEWFEG